MYPPAILAASAGAGCSSLVLFWAGITENNGLAIDGATVTGIASIVGLVIGAVASWRNQKIALEKIRSEAHDREQARKYQSEKEEMDRKERVHDLANKLNLLNVRLEQKEAELERTNTVLDRTNAELAELRRHIDGHDSEIGQTRDEISANRSAIDDIREKADSGSFKPVRLPDDKGKGGPRP